MIQATLLLEGGAARGIFTSGVLDYLLEKDCIVSDVIGMSAGASNAIGYVANQKGWARDCLIHEEGSFSYYNLRSFIRSKSFVDMELMFDKLPNKKVPFDYDSYFASKTNCRIGVTNCITGETQYRTETEDRERLMTLCKASCSLPALSPMVRIDEVPYLDGGMSDSVPVEYAQSIGNVKLIVILIRNPGYRKGANLKSQEIAFKILYRRYPELVQTLNTRFKRYDESMNYLEELERMGKVFVIRPQVKLCGRMEQNPAKLASLYKHGYEYMEQEHENLLKYLDRK